ncbi:hypothetical protein SAY86_014325 [Trapa natans]|uniref:DNL-type domain-containing protein n=1 Tax=Trapa natans TaxID=22666 RepID=A0AAN7QRA2_TRANT|nr:hypothetical protein SAY86_014325 [Trapa natans]
MVKHPIAEADEKSIFGSLTAEEFYARHSVTHGSEYVTNPRGLKIFRQWWIPAAAEPVGIVAIVHGYTSESNWLNQLTSILFAESGFAVCGLDHQGHGFSDGLITHIPDINHVVDDCISFFDSFRGRYRRDLPAFLYSESLGGAIALYITFRQKGLWDGLVLNGAMCGISAKFKPPWPLEHLLSIAAALIPTWRVVPTRGTIPDVSFKEEWKRKLALASPRRSVARPRAATANELVRICKELQGRFEEVEVPFIVVHGDGDVVCDPECVKQLYSRASSEDKTLRIYEGMWHQLVGEPEESTNKVFGEVVEWLISRAERRAANGVPNSNGTSPLPLYSRAVSAQPIRRGLHHLLFLPLLLALHPPLVLFHLPEAIVPEHLRRPNTHLHKPRGGGLPLPSMAASRMFQRRFFTFLSSSRTTSSSHGAAEASSWHLLPSLNALFSSCRFHGRGLHTSMEPMEETASQSEDAPGSVAPSASGDNQSPEMNFSAMSNLKTTSRHNLAMLFTCKVCETRSVKMACRDSYEKGVVVVRCSGCNNLHLIADRLGWFGEPGSIEDFLAARGEEVKRGSVDTLNLTLEDLVGSKS